MDGCIRRIVGGCLQDRRDNKKNTWSARACLQVLHSGLSVLLIAKGVRYDGLIRTMIACFICCPNPVLLEQLGDKLADHSSHLLSDRNHNIRNV